jgi:hypothetical protein
MKSFTLQLILLFLIILPIQSFTQELFTAEFSGVQFLAPGGWFYQQENDTVTFYPDENNIAINIITHESNSVEKIINIIVEDLKNNFKDLKISEPTENEINGMKGWEFHGTAIRNDDVAIFVDFGVFVTPKNRVLELGIITTSENLRKYQDDIQMVIKGIKPIE